MVRYCIAMGVRVACVIACFFAQGWWLLAFVIGAVLLPYIAVVIANVGYKEGGVVERPASMLPVPYRSAGARDE